MAASTPLWSGNWQALAPAFLSIFALSKTLKRSREWIADNMGLTLLEPEERKTAIREWEQLAATENKFKAVGCNVNLFREHPSRTNRLMAMKKTLVRLEASA